jgi:hypothetical protein
MIFIGTILVVGSLFFWKNPKQQDTSVRIPKSLTGKALSQVNYGPEAVKEITQLHNKDLGAVSGAMGMYGNDQLTVWVAGFSSEPTAAQMVNAMREKITPGKFPFSPTGSLQVGGRTIYKLDGMGQKHYYFQSNKFVIWLAANENLAEAALEEILIYYP